MKLVNRTLLEKCACDNGFPLRLGEKDDWLLFSSHSTSAKIALSVSNEGDYLIGTAQKEIASILKGEFLSVGPELPKFHTFTVTNASRMYRVTQRIWNLAKSLPSEPFDEYKNVVKNFPLSTDIHRWERQRIGQNIFRAALLRFWDRSCAVTGVANENLLRASHVIPWARCSDDRERLSVYNGILLVGTLDLAFDNGLLSFDTDGGVLISKLLDKEDRRLIGIDESMRLRRTCADLSMRLKWHRENVFN